MSETDEVTFDAPASKPMKPKKKAAKKRTASARKEPKAAGAQFPGLTKTGCADGCNAKGCVISGKPYCAHPTKGGLQTADMNNDAALRRLKAAREQLGVRIDPDRFKD
jgi:hypothetical protein